MIDQFGNLEEVKREEWDKLSKEEKYQEYQSLVKGYESLCDEYEEYKLLN